MSEDSDEGGEEVVETLRTASSVQHGIPLCEVVVYPTEQHAVCWGVRAMWPAS